MQIDFAGTRVGPYILEAEIGHGGMGRVYRASRHDTTQLFAIKIVNPLTTRDEKFEQRFWREISVVNRLHHPAILQIYASGQEQDGTMYMVMPLITNGTLKDLLMRRQSMTPAEAIQMVSQIGNALDYAHTQGVIHRDVKPHNIMILDQDNYCLTDFGVASLSSIEETVSNLTSTGATLGTFAYMSPEQIAGGEMDGRADIYSLGVVLYQVLLGRLPFAGDNTATLLSQQLHSLPVAPHLVNPDFPEDIETVLDKTLAKRPDERYQSGAALAKAFEEACADLSEDVLNQPLVNTEQISNAVNIANTVIARIEPAPPQRFNRRWLLAGLAMLVLAVAACGFVVLPLQAQLAEAQGTAAALGSSTPIVVTSVVTNAAGEQVIIQVTTTPEGKTATPTLTGTPARNQGAQQSATPAATASPQPTLAPTILADGSTTGGATSGTSPTDTAGTTTTTGNGSSTTGATNSGGASTGGSSNGGGNSGGNSGSGSGNSGGKGGKP